MLPLVVILFLVNFKLEIANCLNTNTYLEENGYQYELHQIQTEDNYILTFHRITTSTSKNKPIVLLVHGILTNSGCYLFDPNQSLGYLLSDMGYDVWLVNCRGTSWSRQHQYLDPDKNPKEFYNFSWHEIGYYDLPASIDYILDKTNQTNLYYIGHSQGSTVFLVMASTRPEYNKKIRLATLMAPASFFENQQNLVFKFLSEFIQEIENFTNILQIYKIPFATEMRHFFTKFCAGDPKICSIIFFGIGGNIKQRNLKDFFATFFEENSLKQFYHFFQLMKNGGFGQYDFGYYKNHLVYQKLKPSRYKLEKISAPVAIYYGKNDRIVNFRDVEKLRNVLPQVVDSFLIPGHFEHTDFLLNRNIYKRLYQRLIELLTNY